ncbi:non-canonical purine NTP pyrophosphatase [Algicola sagamiensis]|uniref:non-canonical purine NTP pyrophosphatase n=1 Tax=Algicola sagamiensis TaxID=163869 RepID=UPI00036EFB4D|nr:non-canonical purine NTP pyrophosphatase [Algicola sagamiensis]
MLIKINSGNKNKLAEYRAYLEDYDCQVEATQEALEEPVSDHETVICYKASQFSDGTLVDDVSLEIEGFDVGVHVRWFLENDAFRQEKYWGRPSVFTCYIGVHKDGYVYLYEGSVEGTIVSPRGNCFGIAPFFLPKGKSKTLGEDMPAELNPRYLALQKFLNEDWSLKRKLIKQWDGEFQ